MTTMPAPNPVFGVGRLAARLRDHLSRDEVEDGIRVIVESLGDPPQRSQTESGAALYVTDRHGIVYIGPYVVPGAPGCAACLRLRLEHAAPVVPANLREAPGRTAVRLLDAATAPCASAVATTLVRRRLERIRTGDADPREVIAYDARAETVRIEHLLPVSECPVCGPRAPRSTVPQFRNDGHPSRLRLREANGTELRAYVSPLGPLERLRRDLGAGFAASAVDVRFASTAREPAQGRGRSFATSDGTAIAEALERFCGYHRGGKVACVRAAYADVRERAIAPASFGTHADDAYDLPGFPFSRIDDRRAIDWVDAYSFARSGPVLVPYDLAFWGPRPDGAPGLVYETSNGCAAGAGIEEATFHGLREVVERDVLLLGWYRRLRLPELDLDDVDDDLRASIARCELITGARFRAHLATMEYGFPAVWLIADCAGADGPATVAGASAHPDLRTAVAGGVEELAHRVLALRHRYSDRRGEALRMLDDPFRVRTIHDHPLVNALPEARGRFAFLSRDEPRIALRDVRRPAGGTRTELRRAVAGLLAAGFDVLVVDQTMPELGPARLHCVKVLVPGLIPMTFGHAFRRVDNLPRLLPSTPLPWPSPEATVTLPHPLD